MSKDAPAPQKRDRLAAEFFRYLEFEKNASKRTLINYRHALTRFREEIKEPGGTISQRIIFDVTSLNAQKAAWRVRQFGSISPPFVRSTDFFPSDTAFGITR